MRSSQIKLICAFMVAAILLSQSVESKKGRRRKNRPCPNGCKTRCKVLANSVQDCKRICMLARDCEVFVYNKPTKKCWMKKLHGWSANQAPDFFSGFAKSDGQIHGNVDWCGGDVCC